MGAQLLIPEPPMAANRPLEVASPLNDTQLIGVMACILMAGGYTGTNRDGSPATVESSVALACEVISATQAAMPGLVQRLVAERNAMVAKARQEKLENGR